MGWKIWVHFAHVLAAVIWVSGGAALSLVGLRVRRSAIAVERAADGRYVAAASAVISRWLLAILSCSSSWSLRSGDMAAKPGL